MQIEKLLEAHRMKKEIKAEYSKKTFGMDKTLLELAIISATFPSAQQYGPKFEKWINHNVGWDGVPSRLGRGDSVTPSRKYIEQKWNIRTDKGPGGLQHRFWQDIDYYLYGHVDDSNTDNITVDLFLLTHDQVVEEAKRLKAVPTHGTKNANESNENVEYSMGVKYGSEDHLRWKELYKVELNELKNL